MSESETPAPALIAREDRLLVGLRLLGLQTARWAAMLLSFTLGVMTVLRPSWEASATALGFMLVCCLPLWVRRGGG